MATKKSTKAESVRLLTLTTAALEQAFSLVVPLETRYREVCKAGAPELAFYPGPLNEDIRAAARALEAALIRCHIELGPLS